MKKEVFEILDLCDQINNVEGMNAFFDYYGNVHYVGARVCEVSIGRVDKYIYDSDTYIPPAKKSGTLALEQIKKDLMEILISHSEGLTEFIEQGETK